MEAQEAMSGTSVATCKLMWCHSIFFNQLLKVKQSPATRS